MWPLYLLAALGVNGMMGWEVYKNMVTRYSMTLQVMSYTLFFETVAALFAMHLMESVFMMSRNVYWATPEMINYLNYEDARYSPSL